MPEWDELPALMDRWTLRTAAPAWDIKRAVADVYTQTPVWYLWHPDSERLGIGGSYAGVSAADLARCKAAASRAVGADHVVAEPQFENDGWVKVAYSPVLRRAGELLNFFEGTYPGGIPNKPSPAAATLTSALVGGGLGYGLGALGEHLLPEGYGKNLKRTGALVGAGLGAVPGLVWGAGNLANNKSVLDPWPLTGPPTDDPHAALAPTPPPATPPLGEMFRNALSRFQKQGDEMGLAGDREATPTGPLAVNVDAVGRTLWAADASPALTAVTLGTLYAASQMPDRHAEPGWVTPVQLGQLAVNAGKDYRTGLLLGAGLNAVVGTPYSPSVFGATTAGLGVIRSVVAKLLA